MAEREHVDEDHTSAVLSTSFGDITVRLYPAQAPEAVRNFVDLAEGNREWTDPSTGDSTTARLYDGTIFHRVISGFMVQGGDPLGTGRGGPGYRFANEISDLTFDRPYLLGMANAGPNTNGSQFFITVETTEWLTGNYTIFGEVVDGQRIVDDIAAVETDKNDRPLKDIVLQSVTIQ